MRAFDAHAIGKCHVPSVILMENAGSGAADVVVRDALDGEAAGKRVVVVCGKGNNGGDGFVIARHLLARGASVAVFCAVSVARLKGDARTNADALLGVGGAVRALATTGDRRALTKEIAGADAVVDALFGTGLDRDVARDDAALIRAINASRCPRVAVDIPSGIDADTGATLGASVRADHTVTFAHPKQGLLTPKGVVATGVLHVVDLGVPPLLGPALTATAALLERADVARLLAPRSIASHKNSAGHVAVFAGSAGKLGAALMVSHAALRAGAGVATIATWDDAVDAIGGRVTEGMVAGIARSHVARSVGALLEGKKVVVAGPGFGVDDAAREAVSALLTTWTGPAIYDADALTLFAGKPAHFAKHKTTCVLTPHPGEAARLLGTTSAAVEADRYAAVRTLASRAGSVVVLKGACTLIAHPDGRVVVNPAATPALATAGSGDTLAGITGAMLASLDPFDAACAAVFIHAAAAEAWSASHGDRGLLATEIADGVPDVLRALTQEHTRGPR
jgi:NAD(P)H-hydrate epimerase